jgi:stress response protein YsnF
MAKTIVALYDDLPTAEAVARALVESGIRREDISLMANDASGQQSGLGAADSADTNGTSRSAASDTGTGATATGAAIGGAVGGLGGFLVGLGALAIPGIGPVVAAGPLAAALIGAGAGAVAGGLIGALTNIGVPEEEAGLYAEGVRRGGALLALRTDEAEADRAIEVMERFDPVDIDTRASEWRQSGWTGFSGDTELAASGAQDTDSLRRTQGSQDEVSIPIVEEQVKVGKRAVERGTVRVRSYVVERPVEETVELTSERLEMERRPVSRPVTAQDAGQAFREQTVEVTETEEEPVVAKEARVVEEVVLSKNVQKREERVRETTRRSEVEVDRSTDPQRLRSAAKSAEPKTPKKPSRT